MAPNRQFLAWSVPSIAVILGLLWFKRKKGFLKADTGGKTNISVKEELAEILKASRTASAGSSESAVVKSAPIDIVPNGTGSQKSSPIALTDRELDLQIERLLQKSFEKKRNRSLGTLDDENSASIVRSKENADAKPREKQSARSLPIRKSVLATVNRSLAEVTISEEEKHNIKTDKDKSYSKNKKNRKESKEVKAVENKEDVLQANMALERASSVEAIDAANLDMKNEAAQSDKSGPADDLRRSAERDSANHSPVDAILASPAISLFSDNHSEGSNDSGKGCSEAASPPPATLSVAPVAGLRYYQFLIPQNLVGILIGRQGYYVTQIRMKTGAHVYVKRHPESSKTKVCVVEGTASEITAALDMIRFKFPERRFPQITLQEVTAELYEGLIVPEFLQLQLVEAVNNDTLVTCLVSAGHVFLQQPTHPTFPSLHALHRLMCATYQHPDIPSLPKPISEGAICAAPTENNWYRAQVISSNEENDTSLVKLVDFGGYLSVENVQLKQIRSDFMTLPFQATEAMLASVKPANSASEWSEEALQVMAGLTVGQLLQTQIAGYDEAGMPLVYLYLTLGAQQVIFLNKELVERGLAEWDVPPDC